MLYGVSQWLCLRAGFLENETFNFFGFVTVSLGCMMCVITVFYIVNEFEEKR